MSAKNKVLLSVLAIAIAMVMTGCIAEEKEDQSSNDGGEESSEPKTLAPKYCGPSASILEYKNGKYWFSMDGKQPLETEGGYNDGVLNLTATVLMQNQPMDVIFTGKPDESGQNLTMNILVSQNGQNVYEQKIFARAASPSLECPQIDMSSLPQFAGSSFDLNQVSRITRFRSSYGHSYTDAFESCRSMKHYFEPKQQVDRYIKLYAPFKARVVSVSNESGPTGDDGVSNQHLVLQSVDHPAMQFDYFHFEFAEPPTLGSIVEAGTELGWGDMYRNGQATNSIDIAVWVNSTSGFRVVSMFDVLSDDALAGYNAWSGLSTRDDYQISKADRDANPIQCSGETFVDEEFEPFFDLNWIDGL